VNARAASEGVAALEALLAAGRDGALLRFGLGNGYLSSGDPAHAAEHLRKALAFDPEYSAAWKLLGNALSASGQEAAALEAYRDGMAAAERKGDKQAYKEMQVFARRLAKRLALE
jgi:predicted Zn-dependent protease